MPMKILVIDDEAHIRRALEFRLRREGFDVLTAEGGVEGLAKIRSEHPDLVLLDIMMDDKDGYEVAEECKADPELKDIPIFLVTAYGQDVEKDKGLSIGVEAYVTKPFRPSQLIEKIRQQLGE